jgi:membrane-associated protease RseP (regulator of RpoE activity)
MVSIYVYDIGFLVLFSLAVFLFLRKNRAGLKKEGIMYLYRTRVGIKFIDYVGTKYKKFLTVYAFLGVVFGYLLMATMMWFLYKLLAIYLFNPEIVRAIKIPPLMPLIPYLPEAFGVSFLPPFYFTYWIISIAVIALFHEFAHGIIARRYNIRILTTGFGFLGPFLAAFVEPDEKEMEDKPKYQQLAVLSAGVFTNLILSVLFFLLLSVFFLGAYAPAGAIFNTYTPGVVEIASIGMIGGKLVSDNNAQGILKVIEDNGIEDSLILGSNDNDVKLTEVIVNGERYYANIDNLEYQLQNPVQEGSVALFEDLPAINVGLKGIIIGVGDIEVKEASELSLALSGFEVGDNVKITTNNGGEVLEYDLVLGEDPNQIGRAIIGIGLIGGGSNERILGQITEFFSFFKEDGTHYEERFNPELVLFIYNLIWWLALINLSVALVNMWPVAIFDGGRFFMLTVWAITGSEKFAMKAFKFVTYAILASLALLMLGYVWAYI